MANKKLTDLTELTTPADNDFLYIVDVSDTTESAQGTSKKIRKDKVDSGASKENIANKQNDLTPDGTGTKYPTVDAVNTIDLQKVINVGGYAEKGNNYIDILGEKAGNHSVEVYVEDFNNTNLNSSLYVSTEGFSASSIGINKSTDFVLNNGFSVIEIENLTSKSTTLKIETPVESTTLNFPAKTVTGTYTLATTDEISTLDSNAVHKTGDETITGSKTFQTDTSSASITILNGSTTPHPAQKIYNFGPGNGLEIDFTTGTGDAIAIFNNGTKTLFLSKEGDISSNYNYIKSSLKLLNSDADLYGDISLNLDRYLFNNKSGNLQFLTQNSGFVTYKSPTISGTFSNANLTANRTFTLPDATGTIPIVSQTITNGVTDKSPSEDAVFDALDRVVKTIITDTPTSTNTGGVSEVLMHTYTVAGGKLPSSCMPNLKVRISKLGTAGTVTIKVRVNTVNDFATATNIGFFTTLTTSKAAVFVRNFTLQGGQLTSYNTANSLVNDEAVSVVDNGVITYDPSVTQYWFFSLQNSNSGDTTRIHSIKLVN